MEETKKLMQQRMIRFFWKIAEEKEALTVDGVPGYNPKGQFVGGKVINFCIYVVQELLRGTEDYHRGREKLTEIIRMTSFMTMETWGILNGITGLRRLQQEGILEDVVDRETLNRLKKSMDWRTFVDVEDHFALIHKPTNYYGVAFGIARFRELLGWEPEGYSKILLDCLMKHIETYSGEFCFMDETRGEGRFDRYSILIPSEVSARCISGGVPVPELIKHMLDRSAHIFLKLANPKGLGFSYGRSIGAYGDTAALEVLGAAVELGGIFDEAETRMAYGYTCRLIKTMIHFWYDGDMESVNMWEKGRKTDDYRNKNRILGENLSLYMQIISALEQWKKAGFTELKEPEGWEQELKKQPAMTLVRFAGGDYERGLVIARDSHNVWSLPVISGGKDYYNHDPYLPVPRQNLVSEGVPECTSGAMVPKLILEDGRVLMPICLINRIVCEKHKVTLFQRQLCVANGAGIQAVDGCSVTTTFTFLENSVTRQDAFQLTGELPVKAVELELQCFSADPLVHGSQVRFAEGTMKQMSAEGYESCLAENAPETGDYDTPRGHLLSHAFWKRQVETGETEIQVSWNLQTRELL